MASVMKDSVNQGCTTTVIFDRILDDAKPLNANDSLWLKELGLSRVNDLHLIEVDEELCLQFIDAYDTVSHQVCNFKGRTISVTPLLFETAFGACHVPNGFRPQEKERNSSLLCPDLFVPQNVRGAVETHGCCVARCQPDSYAVIVRERCELVSRLVLFKKDCSCSPNGAANAVQHQQAKGLPSVDWAAYMYQNFVREMERIKLERRNGFKSTGVRTIIGPVISRILHEEGFTISSRKENFAIEAVVPCNCASQEACNGAPSEAASSPCAQICAPQETAMMPCASEEVSSASKGARPCVDRIPEELRSGDPTILFERGDQIIADQSVSTVLMTTTCEEEILREGRLMNRIGRNEGNSIANCEGCKPSSSKRDHTRCTEVDTIAPMVSVNMGAQLGTRIPGKDGGHCIDCHEEKKQWIKAAGVNTPAELALKMANMAKMCNTVEQPIDIDVKSLNRNLLQVRTFLQELAEVDKNVSSRKKRKPTRSRKRPRGFKRARSSIDGEGDCRLCEVSPTESQQTTYYTETGRSLLDPEIMRCFSSLRSANETSKEMSFDPK